MSFTIRESGGGLTRHYQLVDGPDVGTEHVFVFSRRTGDPHSLVIDQRYGDRRIEVYVSPTGRSRRIFVDGKEIKP